ncbi:MAG: sugar kinase [Alphaproteobacteria bacterium]|nr:MAG: sugar kinase [Alphaproteobacteria bacterium]
MKRVVAFGECMVEFREIGNRQYQSSFAGDVYNSCVYMRRALDVALKGGFEVSFMTAVGQDAISDDMVKSWQEEGLDTSLVFRSDERTPGLYMINTDEGGERSFTYWRTQSAARDTMKFLRRSPDLPLEADLFYFSGISMAILGDDDRAFLLDLVRQMRGRGTIIAFDPNYRRILWHSIQEARDWITQCYQLTDIALPGLEDEQTLFNRSSVGDVIKNLQSAGVGEMVIKAGEQGMFGLDPEGRFHLPFTAAENCIDTTAAGDSFCGIYLSNRLQGLKAEKSVQAAARAAAFVVGHPGAIVPRDVFEGFLKRVAPEGIVKGN